MLASEIGRLPGFEKVTTASDNAPVRGVYCADLLSWALRAPEGSAWCTIMGNVNAVGVAFQTDVAAMVLCEGASLDKDAEARAGQHGVAVFKTSLPIFEAGLAIARAAGLYPQQA